LQSNANPKQRREKREMREKNEKGATMHHQPSHALLYREDLVTPLPMEIWMVVFRYRGQSHEPLERGS
jgi:hypothetical protein